MLKVCEIYMLILLNLSRKNEAANKATKLLFTTLFGICEHMVWGLHPIGMSLSFSFNVTTIRDLIYQFLCCLWMLNIVIGKIRYKL